jgi:hypothetical protein
VPIGLNAINTRTHSPLSSQVWRLTSPFQF